MLARSIVFFFAAGACLAQTAGQRSLATTLTDGLLADDSQEYPEFAAGPTIETNIANGKGFDAIHGEYIFVFHPHEERSPGRAPLSDKLSSLKDLTYNSDAVVLATPLTLRSALTVNHKFVFTDYIVRIDSVYHDKGQTISKGITLVVSRPGGRVDFSGVKVQAFEPEYPAFRLEQQYVLFLHRRPSGSFYVGPSDAFLLKDRILRSVRPHPIVDLSESSFEEVIHKVQTAAQESTRSPR